MHQPAHRPILTEQRLHILEVTLKEQALMLKEQALWLKEQALWLKEQALRLDECEQNCDYLLKQEQRCQYFADRIQDLETHHAWYLNDSDT